MSYNNYNSGDDDQPSVSTAGQDALVLKLGLWMVAIIAVLMFGEIGFRLFFG